MDRETLYFVWRRGDMRTDFDRQCAMSEKIDAILLEEFGDCQEFKHTCRLFNGGKPTICRGMVGGCGQGVTESYLRYYIPVGPKLDKIRLSLLAVGSCYSDIRTTLGDTTGGGYFPVQML